MIICKKCNIEKNIDNFYIREVKPDGSKIYRWECKDCWSDISKEYRNNNEQELKIYRQNYYLENKEIIDKNNLDWAKENPEKKQKINKKYYDNNSDEILKKGRIKYYDSKEYQIDRSKNYRNNNKENIKFKRRERAKIQRINDPAFKLKENVSRTIRNILKKNGSSKKGKSFLKYLPYDIQELKTHFENKFKFWMSWNNYGIYNKESWINSDQSTWTWNIDHIIPQSILPYTSMEDDNFKKCWSLDNLRPYSAKQNFLDGILKIRHNKDVI